MGTKSESKYERLRKIGVGSYGVVFKCVNRQSGQVVAIKRYSENDTDPIIRKIAMREVRMLRQLKHSNLINLIEVFRRKRRLHLVFDYCELTVLDVIEKYGNSCPINLIKKIVWQIVNGINYCHTHNCIHRDIKPENILINQAGVVKLCDFGFARQLNNGGYLQNNSFQSKTSGGQQSPLSLLDDDKETENMHYNERQALTEYVATRWYRAPELLIGEIYYDFKIDIWAIGCVAAELMRGEPIWPGQTDLDQLFMIKSSLGPLTSSQVHTLLTQNLYDQTNIERLMNQTKSSADSIERKLPVRIGQLGFEFVSACLQIDPQLRPPSYELLHHGYIQSARMFQFMKEASGAAAAAYGGGGEIYLSAKSDQQHYNQPLIEPTDSRRSNSQSLMLATNGQLPAAVTTTTNIASKRIVQLDSGLSTIGSELPVAKRANTNKLEQLTPKQRENVKTGRKQDLATIYQAQATSSNEMLAKSRHSRALTNTEVEKSTSQVTKFKSRLPNALPGVTDNGCDKRQVLDLSASSSSNVSDTLINHNHRNRTTAKVCSYLPTLVPQPVDQHHNKPGRLRQGKNIIATSTKI